MRALVSICLTLLVCIAFWPSASSVHIGDLQRSEPHECKKSKSCSDFGPFSRQLLNNLERSSTVPCHTDLKAYLDARWAQPHYEKVGNCPKCFSDRWGPSPIRFKKAVAPSKSRADCPFHEWARDRLLKTIHYIIGKDLNYCHHRTATWLPPPSMRVWNEPCDHTKYNQEVGTDSPDKISKTGCAFPYGKNHSAEKYQTGIDCSVFTSLAFNLAFGVRFYPNAGRQGCGSNAVGFPLQIDVDLEEDLAKLRPGDLLFLKSSKDDHIGHVYFWTGLKADTTNPSSSFYYRNLLLNTKTGKGKCDVRSKVENDVEKRVKEGKDIYIIADSTGHGGYGPSLRLFGGWWRKSFAFARRVISNDDRLIDSHDVVDYIHNGNHVTAEMKNGKCFATKKPVPSASTGTPRLAHKSLLADKELGGDDGSDYPDDTDSQGEEDGPDDSEVDSEGTDDESGDADYDEWTSTVTPPRLESVPLFGCLPV